jgi:hypothetical protein
MVANTGSSNGPSFTSNDKNQATTIGSNIYTYSSPSQGERVKVNALTDKYSGLRLSNQSDTSGIIYYTCRSCRLLVNERLPNSSGSKVNAYDYDPYGVILHETQQVTNP